MPRENVEVIRRTIEPLDKENWDRSSAWKASKKPRPG